MLTYICATTRSYGYNSAVPCASPNAKIPLCRALFARRPLNYRIKAILKALSGNRYCGIVARTRKSTQTMNKPSISFIIPYYKVELPLLARAITSILRLGQKADWEVWVINDGTPGHEAEDYLGSLDDPRIHYHVQPNLGLGGARNTGMEMAQKEYIQFLDADDFLFQKAFSQILDVLGEKHPDLLSFEFKKSIIRDYGIRMSRLGKQSFKEVELISCSNTIYTVLPVGMYSKSLYSTA